MTAEPTTFAAPSEAVACSPDSGGWIATVAPEEATGLLAEAYDHQREVLGRVTGITRLGSLHPELVAERLRLYDVVGATPSTIPEWARRAVILTVTILNGCDFCTASNSEKLAGAGRAELALSIARDPMGSTSGDSAVDALLAYARRLTLEPAAVEESDVAALRQVGWDDMDILDLNNLVAYYAYVNRITSGLGLGASEGPR